MEGGIAQGGLMGLVVGGGEKGCREVVAVAAGFNQ